MSPISSFFGNSRARILLLAGVFLSAFIAIWLRRDDSKVINPPDLSCGAAGQLPWPVAVSGPVPLGKGYLQLQEEQGIHTGLDIMAPAGTDVFAVQDGTVVWESMTNVAWQYEFVIAPSQPYGDEETGLLYVHVDRCTKTFVVDQKVKAGQKLGEVAAFNQEGLCVPPAPSGCYDHLHLQWVVPGGGDWSKNRLAIGSPMALLAPTNDDSAPTVLDMPASVQGDVFPGGCSPGSLEFAFRLDESPDYVCPDALPAEQPLDMVLLVEDQPDAQSDWNNVPFCFSVTITEANHAAAPFTSTVRLDRPEATSFEMLPHLYSTDGVLETNGDTLASPRRFYLVVTNGMYTNGYWTPEAVDDQPTDYEITVGFFDSAGNIQANAATTVVTVVP